MLRAGVRQLAKTLRVRRGTCCKCLGFSWRSGALLARLSRTWTTSRGSQRGYGNRDCRLQALRKSFAQGVHHNPEHEC
jgi:hypothetical protein